MEKNNAYNKNNNKPSKFTFEECKEWIKNPFVNPRNHKKITEKSKAYSQLAKQCYSFDLRNIVWTTKKKDIKSITNSTYPTCEKVYDIFESVPKDDLKIFNSVTRIFMMEAAQEIIPNAKKACFGDLLGDVFKKKYEKIGKGGYGTVYLINPVCGNFPIVIKIARVYKDNEAQTIIEKKYNAEIFILTFLRNLFKLKHIPNYPLLYAWNWCDVKNNEKLSLSDIVEQKQTSIKVNLFMESYNTTLSQVFREKWLTNKHLENIMLQCFLSLAIGQETAGLTHTDIKSSNFLVKYIDPKGYWYYEIKGDKYFVENMGILIVMNDFGLSKLCKPDFSAIDDIYNFKNYGDRSIYIDDGKIKHIKYKYCLKRDNKNGFVKSINDPNKFFQKHIANNLIDLEPINIKLDLNDIEKFPPTEFLDDIIDVTRMFIGGRHSLGYMDHEPPIYVNFKMKNKLKELIKYNDIYNLISRRGQTHMFSAKQMLKILYPDTKKPENQEIIEEFIIN